MRHSTHARAFFETYTKDFTKEDLGKLFTYETPEAYRFFARGINTAELEGPALASPGAEVRPGILPRVHDAAVAGPPRHLRPGAGGLPSSVWCSCSTASASSRSGCRFRCTSSASACPGRSFPQGTAGLLIGFLLMNLLVLLEVADRLSLKRDLEVAREIQQAMLPDGMWSGPGVEAFGLTKPANTVGGDFYDILPQPDGTRHRRARRRRRQGQPGGAADGAAAGDDAHARGRGPRHRRPGRAAERADRQARAAVAVHHAVCRFVRPSYRRDAVRQRRSDTSAAAAAKWDDRAADDRRHRARHVRGVDLRRRAPRIWSPAMRW